MDEFETVEFLDVMLIPTRRCNYFCDHCCRDAVPDGPIMSRRVAWEVSELLRQVGCCEFLTISGGEPLMMSYRLWQNVAEALAHLEAEVVWVVTNGEFLLHPASAARALYGLGLIAQTVQAREVCVELSLDWYHNAPVPHKELESHWHSFWNLYLDDYVYPSRPASPRWALCDVKVNPSVRRGIKEEHIVPRGRAADWSPCEFVDCLDQNCLVINHRGEVLACSEDGGVIGRVGDGVELLGQRMARFREIMRERFGVPGRDSTLRARACRHCDEIAAEVVAEVR